MNHVMKTGIMHCAWKICQPSSCLEGSSSKRTHPTSWKAKNRSTFDSIPLRPARSVVAAEGLATGCAHPVGTVAGAYRNSLEGTRS